MGHHGSRNLPEKRNQTFQKIVKKIVKLLCYAILVMYVVF